MNARRVLLALVVVCVLAAQPGHGAGREWVTRDGVIITGSSCPQAAFAFTPCPCDNPIITDQLFSTKIDLSGYVGKFVTIKAQVAPGTCLPDLLDVRKVDVWAIPPPCACPAAAGH